MRSYVINLIAVVLLFVLMNVGTRTGLLGRYQTGVLILHDPGRRLGADEDGLHVDVEDLAKLFDGIVVEAGAGGNARVVGQDVQTAEALLYGGEGLRHRLRVAEIGPEAHDPALILREPGQRLVHGLLPGAHHHHVVTVFQVFFNDRQTDAAGAAGDGGRLVL